MSEITEETPIQTVLDSARYYLDAIEGYNPSSEAPTQWYELIASLGHWVAKVQATGLFAPPEV